MIRAPINVPKTVPIPPDETGAAQNDRGDRIQLVTDAQLALGTVEAAGAHDAAKPRQKSADAIGENQNKRHGNAGQSGRLRITADRIDVHS